MTPPKTKRGPGRPRKKPKEPTFPPLDAEDVDDELDEDDEDSEEDSQEATINRFLAEYGEDTSGVSLSRFEGGAWVYLDRLTIEEASLNEIKNKYGGGRFQLRLLNAKGKYLKSFVVRIAGKAKDPDEENKNGIDPSLTGVDRLLARLDSLEKSNAGGVQNEILKLVVAAALRPPPAPVAPTRDPMLETLITALIGGKQNGGGMDQMQMLKLLGDAEKRGEDRGRTLGEALAAAAGEGDGVARVLASTLPQVIDAFGKAQQTYAGRVPAPRVPAATAHITEPTTPSAPSPQEGPTVDGTNWIAALRPAVPLILQWANSNKDAQVKAANTVDDLRDDIREAIAIQAEEPGFVASVIAAIPEFQQPQGVKMWVTIFLSTVQEILTTADESPAGAESVEA